MSGRMSVANCRQAGHWKSAISYTVTGAWAGPWDRALTAAVPWAASAANGRADRLVASAKADRRTARAPFKVTWEGRK